LAAAASTVLGLRAGATVWEIKADYRCLARERHPDVVGAAPGAAADFVRLHDAYATISDPDSRVRYNRFGGRGWWSNVDSGERCRDRHRFGVEPPGRRRRRGPAAAERAAGLVPVKAAGRRGARGEVAAAGRAEVGRGGGGRWARGAARRREEDVRWGRRLRCAEEREFARMGGLHILRGVMVGLLERLQLRWTEKKVLRGAIGGLLEPVNTIDFHMH
ncbi:hypothetical protein BAE44_0011457, partial [Dichanthelium oligosanthes]